ncbi:MAG: glycerol-3-phosphate 1-O-acyltransferase PlsY [Lentisphaeria bacterium]|nr:glycerol-3-phosphate 1-O-acyltransferase PlsY [Candidatus Neomarinimicrobiota bacterium]MCF7841894.1 glycerol-3-phosphate 1-O-acyltransferase PlsY [Lentisphaeria bacterium]
MLILIVVLFLSYIIGSIPTSIIVSRLFYHTDIREYGSKNAGATNVFRTFGWKPALTVMLVDVLKGWFPAWYVGTHTIEGIALSGNVDALMIMAGFAAVLGHTYTVFARFKGGKGVGTAAGMLIALFPVALPICLAVFILTLLFSGMVSLGSMLAALTLPIVLILMIFLAGYSVSQTLMIFSLLIPLFIIFTHRSNVGRILAGTENRFEKAMIFRKKKP